VTASVSSACSAERTRSSVVRVGASPRGGACDRRSKSSVVFEDRFFADLGAAGARIVDECDIVPYPESAPPLSDSEALESCFFASIMVVFFLVVIIMVVV